MNDIKIRGDFKDPLWMSTDKACKLLGRHPRTLLRWERKETYLEKFNIILPPLETKIVNGKKYYYLPILQEYLNIFQKE